MFPTTRSIIRNFEMPARTCPKIVVLPPACAHTWKCRHQVQTRETHVVPHRMQGGPGQDSIAVAINGGRPDSAGMTGRTASAERESERERDLISAHACQDTRCRTISRKGCDIAPGFTGVALAEYLGRIRALGHPPLASPLYPCFCHLAASAGHAALGVTSTSPPS